VICGHPEWASDARVASNSARVANRADIVALVAGAIAQEQAAHWLGRLEQAGIPAGPINTVSQALGDVQAQHRQMVRTIAGTPLVGSPVRLDGEREDAELPPPALGEHTDEILHAIGIDDATLCKLRKQRVIAQSE
jgi:formyl-CoA transferase